MNRLAHLLNQEHIHNQPESKWIKTMSKDELVKANEDYQRLVELDERDNDKQQTEMK